MALRLGTGEASEGSHNPGAREGINNMTTLEADRETTAFLAMAERLRARPHEREEFIRLFRERYDRAEDDPRRTPEQRVRSPPSSCGRPTKPTTSTRTASMGPGGVPRADQQRPGEPLLAGRAKHHEVLFEPAGILDELEQLECPRWPRSLDVGA